MRENRECRPGELRKSDFLKQTCIRYDSGKNGLARLHIPLAVLDGTKLGNELLSNRKRRKRTARATQKRKRARSDFGSHPFLCPIYNEFANATKSAATDARIVKQCLTIAINRRLPTLTSSRYLGIACKFPPTPPRRCSIMGNSTPCITSRSTVLRVSVRTKNMPSPSRSSDLSISVFSFSVSRVNEISPNCP